METETKLVRVRVVSVECGRCVIDLVNVALRMGGTPLYTEIIEIPESFVDRVCPHDLPGIIFERVDA